MRPPVAPPPAPRQPAPDPAPIDPDPSLQPDLASERVLLVGGGKMGGALLRGWAQRGLADCVVVDPGLTAAGGRGLAGARVVADPAAMPAGFAPSAVVLAVKPQLADAVLPAYAGFGGVFVSVMAGCDLAGLARLLPGRRLARAMPNIPAAIGAGMSVACAAPGLDPTGRALVEALLRAAGDVAWIDDESLMDAVTAVSGCGPAYVFLLAELLEAAGREQGLPAALARRLARRTVAGAGAMLDAGDEDAAAMRRAVTSRNGVTQSALEELMHARAWPLSIRRAAGAAVRRSRELSGIP